MAREAIAKNDKYMYEVDTDINRLFITMWGFWESVGVVPNLRTDMALALDKLRPGYTVLVDTTQLKTPPRDVMDAMNRVQQDMVAKGVSKNAEVVSSAFVEVNLEEVASRSEFGKVMRQFKSMVEALEWLNEK
jgi:hypothetical protein